MSRFTAYIDMTVKVEEGNLPRFLDVMEMLKQDLEDAANCYGELLEFEIREGEDEDEAV